MNGIGRHTQRSAGTRWLALFVVIALVIVCMLPLNSHAESSIRLAMITAKTGEAGRSNSISFPAARFAVDEINANGGILGRQVELLEYDNFSTPAGSAAAGHQAIKDGVIGVVGCNWSSHSLGLAKVLQEAKVPMISHVSTNEAVTKVGDYIFRVCFTDSFQGLGLARFSRTNLGDKTAVVLVDETRTYSIGLAETFTKAFEHLGGKVLWRGTYRTPNPAYDELLEKVVELNPDVLFIPGGYADVSGFFGRVGDYNTKPHLLSADGIGIRLYEYLGSKANGVYYSSHWSRWVDTERSRSFVQRYEEQVGPVNEDTIALVYDSFMVFKEAIERADSLDTQKIRDALALTPGHEGVTGTIRFNAHGDPIKPMVINKFKFGGIMFLDQVYP